MPVWTFKKSLQPQNGIFPPSISMTPPLPAHLCARKTDTHDPEEERTDQVSGSDSSELESEPERAERRDGSAAPDAFLCGSSRQDSHRPPRPPPLILKQAAAHSRRWARVTCEARRWGRDDRPAFPTLETATGRNCRTHNHAIRFLSNSDKNYGF